jgi:hypothetical protein
MDEICSEEQLALIPGGDELFASPSCYLRSLAPRLDDKVLSELAIEVLCA